MVLNRCLWVAVALPVALQAASLSAQQLRQPQDAQSPWIAERLPRVSGEAPRSEPLDHRVGSTFDSAGHLASPSPERLPELAGRPTSTSPEPFQPPASVPTSPNSTTPRSSTLSPRRKRPGSSDSTTSGATVVGPVRSTGSSAAAISSACSRWPTITISEPASNRAWALASLSISSAARFKPRCRRVCTTSASPINAARRSAPSPTTWPRR